MDTQLRSYAAGLIEASALLLAAVVPVFVNFYSFRVFEPDKHAVFLSLATVGLLAGLIAFSEGRMGGLPGALRQPLVLAALLLALTTAMSAATSIVPRYSLFGSSERAQGLVGLLAALAVFATVGWVAQNTSRRRRLVSALLLGSVPVALLALVQAMGLELVIGEVESEARVFGTLSNPIFLGAYLMALVPFAVARAFDSARSRRLPATAVYVLVAVVQVAALWLSASRGPILGLGVGLFVMLLASAVAIGRRRAALAATLAAVAVLVFLAVFNLPGSPLASLGDIPVLGRFGEISSIASGSEATRVRIWEASNRLLAGQPARLVTGYGPEAYKYALIPYSEANMPGRGQADRLVDRGHNVLLDALVMTGVPGAIGLLCVYGAWIFTALAAMGLLVTHGDRLRCAGFLVAGTAVGALSWLVVPVYGAALTLLGMLAGLAVFLALLIWRGAPDSNRLDLTAAALLALGAATVAEAAFGIQTVVTQTVFWLSGGLLLGMALGGEGPTMRDDSGAVRGGQARRGQRSGRESAGSEGDETAVVTIGWSPTGASLGVAAGAVASALVYGFVLYGVESLPAVIPTVAVVLLATWALSIFLAVDAEEGAFAAGLTGLTVVVSYAILRMIVLVAASDAAVLFAVTVVWFIALALLAGVWLRAPTQGRSFWIGPVGLIYPVVATVAVTFIFVFGVRRVQADIYFQSALANFSAALSTDDEVRFQIADELYGRATGINPGEALYPMKWGELYTQLGTMILSSPQADANTASPAFGRAQNLFSEAEEIEPRMPYHKYNRGHLQLIFAQTLPLVDEQAQLTRMQVAQNAAVALEEAFAELPYDPQVANDYAMARLLEGRAREAIGLLEYSLELDPELPTTYALLGQAYASDGQIDSAEQVLQRAIELGVDSGQVLGTLGDLAREAGDMGGAISYYQQAVQAEPEQWMLHYNLGLMYAETGEMNEAMSSLMSALAVAPAAEQQRVQDAIDSIMGTSGEMPVP